MPGRLRTRRVEASHHLEIAMTDQAQDPETGSASTPPDVAVPQPEQAPMDDDAGGPTVPSPDEDEAAKLGDFA
jgi:hypothetical protein